MTKRILTLTLILVCSCAGWMLLSVVIDSRSDRACSSMSDAVCDLWGELHVQSAPTAKLEWTAFSKDDSGRTMPEARQQVMELAGSSVQVGLTLEYRKKGLIWFSMYNVSFDGVYTLNSPADQIGLVTVRLAPPSPRANYENIVVEAPGCPDLTYEVKNGALIATFTVSPHAQQKIKFSYDSRGRDSWTYSFGENTQMVKNFRLLMNTNFDDVDFPRNTISPSTNVAANPSPGRVLSWDKGSMVSTFQVGMLMPHRLNPGPLASAMSKHAPVSLLFYFFVIFLLQSMRNIKIHPMNYFFLAASFFAFNLLFSYLVDRLELKWSFGIAALVSLLLVVSYLQVVVGARFAIVEAGLAQLIYQVMFAFAHFYEGATGLAVTIGAILTLAVVMRLTAKVDWEAKFAENDKPKPPFRRPAPSWTPPPPLNPEVPGGNG
jgi:hypothetical protein